MTKIKICGLTREEDIFTVNLVKPDYIGFVFAKSKRQVDYEQAKNLRAKLVNEIKVVGVFVNEDMKLIEKLCQRNIIDLVQLHGDEDEGYIYKIKQITEKPIIKAFRISKNEDIKESTADFVLFDTYNKNAYGGTGESFCWDLIGNYNKPFFLAGGININNMVEAIKTIKPYCLDISSGVETDGIKDRIKMIEIMKLKKIQGE